MPGPKSSLLSGTLSALQGPGENDHPHCLRSCPLEADTEGTGVAESSAAQGSLLTWPTPQPGCAGAGDRAVQRETGQQEGSSDSSLPSSMASEAVLWLTEEATYT